MTWKLRIVVEGRACTLFSIERDSTCLLNEFFNDVSQTHEYDFARFQRTIDRIADSGPLQNPEVFKPLRDEIHEIKIGVLRILCFEHNGHWYCTNGFIKKSQKTPIGEIKTARWLRSLFLVENGKHEIPIES